MQSVGNPNNPLRVFNGGMQPIGNPNIRGNIALAQMMAQPHIPVSGAMSVQQAPASQPAPPLAQAMAAPMPYTPYNPQVYGALQTPQVGPVQHPLEALARALMPLAGNYQQGKNMQVERQQGDLRNQALAQALATYKGGDSAGAMMTPNLGGGAQEAFLGAALKPPPTKDDYTIGNQRFSGATNQVIATGAPDDKPSPGFMYGAPGTGEVPVPGGPADPQTIAAQAAARDPFFFQQTQGPDGATQTIAIPRNQVPAGGGVVGERAAVIPDRQRKQAEGITTAISAVQALIDDVEANGLQTGAFGEAGGRQATLVNNAKLQLKNAYDLGALQGADMGLLMDILGDPTAFSTRVAGLGGPGNFLGKARTTLETFDPQIKALPEAAFPSGKYPAIAPAAPGGGGRIDFNTLPPEVQQQVIQALQTQGGQR